METSEQDYAALLLKELAAVTDFEGQLEVLRIFTREQQARLRERDLSGNLSLEALFLELSRLAEAVLLGSEQVAREELRRQGESDENGGFAVVAMGKFGGRELTYHSDLDLIFFYDQPASQEFAGRLATRIISALSVLTRNGWAYRIDAALRPSGNSGALVCSLSSFRDYHREVGQTWERQALTKARVALGNPPFRTRLEEAFVDIAYQNYDASKIAGEINHLRDRMEREIAKERPGRYNLKTGRGGIVDIEFTVQYLQLIHGKSRPNLRKTNTLSAIAALAGEEILDPGLAQTLRKTYLFYRELETRLRLILDQAADELWEGSEISQRMISNFFPGRPVFEELKQSREEVRRLYDRILKGGACD